MRILLLLALLLCTATSQAQQMTAAEQQALDSLLRAHWVPALAAAITEPGRIRYVLGGTRRNDQPGLVQLADYWHLGSNTKAITRFIAAKLVERGKLRWDSQLLDVVPELRGHVRPDRIALALRCYYRYSQAPRRPFH